MKIFLPYLLMILTVIASVSLQGCEEEEELPQVIAGFTQTINEDTGTVTFLNTSENATKYLWDFGDTKTSKEIDPVKTYMSGTYIVTLTASNVAGGSDIFVDTLNISIRGIITIPATFDNPNINYKATAIQGASFEIVDNPDVSGTNNKASKVGAITNSGTLFEGIFFDLGSQLDLTTNKRITMNFWADAPVDVLLKLEQGTSAAIEKSVSHGGTGWESLSFDFNSSAKYSRLTLFVDGPGTKTGTFYFDDIIQEASPVVPVTCTAETVQSLLAADFNLTHLTDPSASIISDNAGFAWVDNPDGDAVNASCKVGQITRTAANPFVNNQIDLNAKLDFNANAGFKVKVYSGVAGFTLTLKLEDKTNSSINTELTVASTVTNEWEELTFPFASSQTNKYDKIIIFFDLGETNSSVYYFDDLKLYSGGGGGPVCTAETVQSLLAADFNLTHLTDPSASIVSDNAGFAWVDNPDPDDVVNESCKVGQVTRTTANAFVNNQIDLNAKLDFSANEGFKVKVYSAVSGYTFTIKLEDKTNSSINTELTVAATTTNQWEELTFPFASGETNKYDKIIIFFDLFETNSSVYYFDDLALFPRAGGGCTETVLALPIDFDCESTTYNFVTFNGASYQVVDNPQPFGINPTVTKVGAITNSGGPWEGGAFTLGTAVDFSTDKSITMKLYSTVALPVLLKFEGAVPPIETPVNHGGTGWEQLTFNFSSSDQFTTLVLFIDGPGTTAGTFYVDDIEQIPTAGGGGSGSELTINGDFETGDLTGWQSFAAANNGTFAATSAQANGGTFSGLMVADVDGIGSPSFPVVKQANIGVGTITPNTAVTVTFDLFGSVAGAGGVVFAELFSELSGGGVSKSEILGGGPLFPNGTWTTYTFNTTTGNDVSGGITLQLKADCGGNSGCVINAYFDNVSVTID